jgi:hypothetical protein
MHNRKVYGEKLQFGLITSGTEAATRDVLLTVDLKPPTHAVVAVDIKNAHTTLARLAAFMVLSRQYAETGHALDLAALKYFLLFYRSFNIRYIKVGKQYRAVFQTDGLDQGEAGRGAISYPIRSNFLSTVFCCILFCILKNSGNTLYSAVFRKCRIWANMPFCILSVFLNNERIHQNTLGIHAKYVFLKVIENTSKYGYEIRIL